MNLSSIKLSQFFFLKLSAFTCFLIILCNLNGVLYLLFGLKAPLSPILLSLSSVAILISLTTYRQKFSSTAIMLYTIFLLSYLGISFGGYLYSLGENLHYNSSIALLLRQYIATFFIVFLAYLATKVFVDKQQLKKIISFIVWTIIFTNVVTAITPLFELGSIYKFAGNYLVDGERTGGFFANANEAGVFGNYLIVIYFSLFLYQKNKRWLLITLFFLGFYNSFISFSKAAMLMVPIITLYFFLFSVLKNRQISRQRRKGLFSILFIAIGFVALIATNFNNLYENLDLSKQRRISNVLALAGGDISKKTTSKRTELYAYGVDLIYNNPLLGHGLGSFHQFNAGPYELGVHNVFLLILGESGILPFLVFLVFLSTLFWKAIRMPNPVFGFMISATIIIFILNLYGTNHNSIFDRPSNILLGFFMALIEKYK